MITLDENHAIKVKAATDLLRLMFPKENVDHWNVEVDEDVIRYCKGDHDSDEDCDLDTITIVQKTPERYQHKKRGTHYTIQSEGILQLEEGTTLKDGDKLISYVGEEDGGLVWYRTPEEFHDGRFKFIKPRKSDKPESEIEPVSHLDRLLKQEIKACKDAEKDAAYNGSYQGGVSASSRLRLLEKIQKAAELDGRVKVANLPKTPDALRAVKIEALWNIWRNRINPFTTYEGTILKIHKDLNDLFSSYIDAIDHIEESYEFSIKNIKREYPDSVFDAMLKVLSYLTKCYDNLDDSEDLTALKENSLARILTIASNFSDSISEEQKHD